MPGTKAQAHPVATRRSAETRLLVCVSENPNAVSLVRYAKRMADALQVPWSALHIETARSHRPSEQARDTVAEALRLAEKLGGEAVTRPGGERMADDVLAYARASNVGQIIIGNSNRSRWFDIRQRAIARDLVRDAGGIDLHVIAAERTGSKPPAFKPLRDGSSEHALRPYAFGLLAVLAALGGGKLVEPLVGLETIDLIFLTAVLVVAAGFGLMPSLLASMAASLAYNFFFLPPTRTLTIAAPANIAAFGFFVLAAVLVSNLAARVRNQMLAAKSRARTTEALYAFSRKIAGIADLDDLLWAAAYQIASMLRVDVVFLLPAAEGLAVKAAYPPEDMLEEEDFSAARSSFGNGRSAGRDTDEMPGAKRHFLPIGTAQHAIGVVGITRERRGVLLTPDDRRLLEALLGQIAIAFERIELARGMDEARIVAETERLRSALLTSLSHDLKTPLASITGAATSLRQYGQLYDTAEREDLVAMIESEADRLGRFVANLLDMTRLEAGSIELRREPVDIGEVVGTALDRCGGLLNGRQATVSIPPDLPMLSGDAVLLEQVLVNLIDNAIRYGPPESGVCVHVDKTGAGIAIEVLDEGPGLPPEELERVFEKFHRLEERNRHRAGTGLGLAICRGFVEALGGTISAANREDRRGAVFAVRFSSSLLVRSAGAEPTS